MSEPPDDLGLGALRTATSTCAAVLATGVLAQLSLAAAGVLAWPVAALLAGLLVLGAAAGVRAGARAAGRLRTAATAGVLVMAAVLLPQALLAGGSLSARGVLAPLLAWSQVLETLTWRSARDLRLSLACALGLLLLAGSYAPDVLVGLPLAAGALTLAASAVLVQRLSFTSAAGAVRASGPAARLAGRTAGATALLAVLAVVAFLLLPTSPARGLRAGLAGGLGTGLPSRTVLGSAAYTGRLDLRTRGELSARPLAVVGATSPSLWRGTAFDTYDGTAWLLPPAPPLLLRGPPWTVATVAGAPRSDRIVVQDAGDGTLYAPGVLHRVEEVQGARGDVVVDSLGNARLVPATTRRFTYAVTAVPVPPALAAPVGTSSTPPAEAPPGGWLALPDALPARVRTLARQVGGTSQPGLATVLAVERYVSGHATYRTDSPVPQPGEDAVDRFLFVDRTGFCEQFASAEAVLLRALGIPTRLVTGLAYGVPAGPGRRLYREADLHAWVEAWLPDRGWVTSDPTARAQPATGPLAAGTGLRQRLATGLAHFVSGLVHRSGGRRGLAALLAAAAFGAWGLARARRGVRARPPGGVPGRSRPVPDRRGGVGPALAAFTRFDARLGGQRRGPGESLRELASRLGVGGELAGALAVVERECYAPEAPAGVPAAVATLDRAGRSLPR